MTCPDCEGTGLITNPNYGARNCAWDVDDCPRCGGDGEVPARELREDVVSGDVWPEKVA